MGDSGERSTEGVVGEKLTYDGMTFSGNFSFSLVTKIRDPVRNVTGLIVFYDIQGNPFGCGHIQMQ